MLTKSPVLLDAAVTRLFIQAMTESASQSYVPDICTVFRSNKKTEVHPYIGASPAAEQITDEWTFRPVFSTSITLTNLKFGAGVQITEDDWDDDAVGGFPQMVQGMGDEAVLLPNALLVDLLINGDVAGNNSYDGQTFFSTTHAAIGQMQSTQSNIYVGTGTTAAAVRTDLNGIIARFGTFRKENDRQANISVRRLTIVAPYAMRQAIIEAVRQEGDTQANISLNGISFRLIFDADLDRDDPNDYYVINSGMRTRGLILQERLAARLIAEGRGTGFNFVNEVRRWKWKWRGVPGYGPYQGVIKVTNV